MPHPKQSLTSRRTNGNNNGSICFSSLYKGYNSTRQELLCILSKRKNIFQLLESCHLRGNVWLQVGFKTELLRRANTPHIPVQTGFVPQPQFPSHWAPIYTMCYLLWGKSFSGSTLHAAELYPNLLVMEKKVTDWTSFSIKVETNPTDILFCVPIWQF